MKHGIGFVALLAVWSADAMIQPASSWLGKEEALVYKALSKRIDALTLSGDNELSDKNLVAHINTFALYVLGDSTDSYATNAELLGKAAQPTTSSATIENDISVHIMQPLQGSSEGGKIDPGSEHLFKPLDIFIDLFYKEALEKIAQLKKARGL